VTAWSCIVMVIGVLRSGPSGSVLALTLDRTQYVPRSARRAALRLVGAG
jgi:hypothetical protein